MGFKTILVHVDTGRSAPARLKLSADLAARFAAHVTGLYVRRPFQAPAFTDAGPAMDSLYRTYENAAKADEALATAAFRDVDRWHGSFKRMARGRRAGRGGRGGSRPLRRPGDRRAGRTGCRGNDDATRPRRDGRHGERTAGADRAPYRRDQAAGKDGDAVLERQPRSGAGGDRRAADPQAGRQGDHPACRSQERWRSNSRAPASPAWLARHGVKAVVQARHRRRFRCRRRDPVARRRPGCRSRSSWASTAIRACANGCWAAPAARLLASMTVPLLVAH